MYRSNTTFVVGAGASLELGFPTGAQLKNQIADAVNFRFEFNQLTNGDHAVFEATRKFADYRQHEENDEANAHFRAGQHIARAMPQAISIDNFVDNQQDERVTAIAKLGIASCLIDAERNCRLALQVDESFPEQVNWVKFQKNWIHHFLQTLTEGARKSEIREIFDGLSFIIFNYDRSFEHYLAAGLANYYEVPLEEAQEVVATAAFMHPYGQIGKLRWQRGELPVQDFGSGDKRNLFEISQSILTFSEQLGDQEYLGRIRGAINDADQLVFLGFAFHSSNMDLLKPKRSRETYRAIATAYGISESDCSVIKDDIWRLCRTVPPNPRRKGHIYIIDENSTCSMIFQKYRKTLSH
jgi:hypothetical protein